jgi:acyl-coenzyme A thioesterase PaaI-like protein
VKTRATGTARRAIAAVGAMAAVLAACAASAQETAGTRWPVPDVEAPQTELVLEAFVEIDPAVEVGASDLGTRRFIPITGGRFVGRGLRGKVMAGGADWQLERPDGVLELDALYALEADDGAVIIVENHGVASVTEADGSRPAERYLRTVPSFRAPQGEHDWLNKGVFVGTVTPVDGGGAVVIRVFHVGRLQPGSAGSISGGADTAAADTAAATGADTDTDAGTDGDSGAYPVTIVEIRRRLSAAVFVTDDGDVWVQTDGRRVVVPDVPFDAEIRPGALGSRFLAPRAGGRAVRVRRP